METAIRVLAESKTVRGWVKGQARFLGADLDTPEGKSFSEAASRQMAETLLK